MSANAHNESSRATEDAAAPRKKSLKLFALGGTALALEALVLIGAAFFFSGQSSSASDDLDALVETPVSERVAEIELMTEQLTNDQNGQVYVYTVKIFVQVAEADRAWFEDKMGQYVNDIHFEVTALWASSEHEALQDPRKQALVGKIEGLIRERFEGESAPEFSKIRKVMVISPPPFRVRS